jgi:hypothetical protein
LATGVAKAKHVPTANHTRRYGIKPNWYAEKFMVTSIVNGTACATKNKGFCPNEACSSSLESAKQNQTMLRTAGRPKRIRRIP